MAAVSKVVVLLPPLLTKEGLGEVLRRCNAQATEYAVMLALIGSCWVFLRGSRPPSIPPW